MSRVPRASLTIDLLDDADFCALMGSRAGRDAFAVFVALLIAGRRMLQQNRAGRHVDGVSLVFFDRPKHVLTRVSLTEKALNCAVDVISTTCSGNGTSPWIGFDGEGRLLIRSFFKYNTAEGWGGDRPGAGRPPKNHLDSEHDESSCAPPLPLPLPAPIPAPAPRLAPGGRVVIGPDKKPVDAEELRRVEDYARSAHGVSCFDSKVEAAARLYPLPYILAALEETPPGKPWGYVVSICKRLQAQGGLDPVPVGNGRASPAPRKPEPKRMDPDELDRIAAEQRKRREACRTGATTN